MKNDLLAKKYRATKLAKKFKGSVIANYASQIASGKEEIDYLLLTHEERGILQSTKHVSKSKSQNTN